MKRAEVIQNTKICFNPWKIIYEGNPQMILDRGEAVSKMVKAFIVRRLRDQAPGSVSLKKEGHAEPDYIRNLGR